jgi:hypothetical protein
VDFNRKLTAAEEKERAFDQRVVGLRNWVDSYKSYKIWQKGIEFIHLLISLSWSR